MPQIGRSRPERRLVLAPEIIVFRQRNAARVRIGHGLDRLHAHSRLEGRRKQRHGDARRGRQRFAFRLGDFFRFDRLGRFGRFGRFLVGVVELVRGNHPVAPHLARAGQLTALGPELDCPLRHAQAQRRLPNRFIIRHASFSLSDYACFVRLRVAGAAVSAVSLPVRRRSWGGRGVLSWRASWKSRSRKQRSQIRLSVQLRTPVTGFRPMKRRKCWMCSSQYSQVCAPGSSS